MQIKDTESEPRPWGAFTAMKLLAWKLVARKCSYETTISNFITWWIPICTPIVHCMVSLLVCITNSPNGFFHWFLARNQQLIKECFFLWWDQWCLQLGKQNKILLSSDLMNPIKLCKLMPPYMRIPEENWENISIHFVSANCHPSLSCSYNTGWGVRVWMSECH